MTQTDALLRLQELELAIIRRMRRLQEIEALLADDARVEAARAEVTAAEDTLAPLRTHARELELEIGSNTQKANISEDELYSGRVRNTKEMQDMQQEVAALQRRNAELEDSLLRVMLSIEEAEGALGTARDGLTAAEATRDDEKRDLLPERAQLQTEVADLRRQRETAMKNISPENLARYSSLRQLKKNQPVAVMVGNTCSACGVEQTRAIEREVLLGQSLATCLSCGRILVRESAAG